MAISWQRCDLNSKPDANGLYWTASTPWGYLRCHSLHWWFDHFGGGSASVIGTLPLSSGPACGDDDAKAKAEAWFSKLVMDSVKLIAPPETKRSKGLDDAWEDLGRTLATR